jgi:hypothetical protein
MCIFLKLRQDFSGFVCKQLRRMRTNPSSDTGNCADSCDTGLWRDFHLGCLIINTQKFIPQR